MGLSAEIQSAIEDLGFVQPTPIQEKVIPFLLESKQDMVALAQTGTGKTAAFGLPIIQQIDPGKRSVQVLILSPTRELAMQIASDLENYSKNLGKIKIAVVYGGSDIRKQISDIENGAQIVVGTPGRTLDLIKRKKLKVNDRDLMIKQKQTPKLIKILKKEIIIFSITLNATDESLHN